MSKAQAMGGSPSESTRDAHDSQNLPLRDVVKLYKKAILWSLAISLSTIMEGYDVVLLGSFFGLTPFYREVWSS
ncbi:MFS transporter SP family general alpha glucoside:H+ symporter [Penicillium cataractarum]|uniref:MFS transporter SP family general alpha glucoside:H+ symporter n=1 Tax=Penicillium cataractarum TaxID=2100454 RepID=A0A9W9VW85_9EURO|nr:MFS transporter SP family general alpha glucoside:H+ symporter [Penicillium cataractarum]KAJ5390552.1 MFS transporter SP family general alpha glucoside:H+ symporter [Penicillium cataractarum]